MRAFAAALKPSLLGFQYPRRSRRRGQVVAFFPPFFITLGSAATSLFIDDLSFMPPYSFFLSRSLSLSLPLSLSRARAPHSLSFFLSFFLFLATKTIAACSFFVFFFRIRNTFLSHFYIFACLTLKKKTKRCSRRCLTPPPRTRPAGETTSPLSLSLPRNDTTTTTSGRRTVFNFIIVVAVIGR